MKRISSSIKDIGRRASILRRCSTARLQNATRDVLLNDGSIWKRKRSGLGQIRHCSARSSTSLTSVIAEADEGLTN